MPQFSQLWGDDLTTELGTNDTSVLFTDARRKHAVNEGLRQFTDLTECVIRQSTLSVSSSAQTFDLLNAAVFTNNDFLRIASQGPIYQVFDSAGSITRTIAGSDDFPQRDIPFLDAAQSGWRSTTPGDPSGWYLTEDGGSKYFALDKPANVSTSETAQLTIPYVPRISSLTSDTAIPWTIGGQRRLDLYMYHQASVHYAAHLMEKLRRDQEASDKQLNAFLGYVQRYNAQKPKKGMKAVRTARSYFRNARGDRESQAPLVPWWR